MIGKKLGHYTIVERIGAGGMGEVYRARDERLERDVAVKLLASATLGDEASRRRFRREALALSRINHPHIATVHDFDTYDEVDFLVMELVAGMPLSERLSAGPLPQADCVRLGIELARALAAAHEAGVIHRDLKPGNLRLTPDGELKVLDFGIARVAQPLDQVSATTIQTADSGGLAGTMPYLSPEQVQGEQATARSDIYAAGAILYELATSRTLFPGVTGFALLEAIVRRSPDAPRTLNPGLSPQLETVILKALEKDPARRYQSARELLAALEPLADAGLHASPAPVRSYQRWLLPLALAGVVATAAAIWIAGNDVLVPPAASSATPEIRSLAVLPLENLSRDADQQYFADAMTDALIGDLAQISALRVISRTSVQQYARARKPLPEIARELNVDAVVEGSVLSAGNRIRINAQLIHAPTDRHLWANSYERVIDDVLALQREMAQAIAAEVRVALTPGERERLSAATRLDPEAYQAYIRGRHHWNRRTEPDLRRAIDLFNDAIRREPSYAVAYTGLADAYASLGFSFDVAALPPREAVPKAKAAALHALELDERLAEAHTSMAFVTFLYDWDWANAERHFRRALELNANYAHAHHWFAHYLLSRGRGDEALRHSRRALALDPLNLIINVHLGWHYMYSGDYPAAIEQLEKTILLDPNYPQAHRYFALPYQQQGQFARAIESLQTANRLSEGSTEILGELGSAYAVAGRRAEARRVLVELSKRADTRYVSPYFAATIHAGLGETEESFRWLDRAFADRSDLLVYVRIEPRLDSLRGDPRFADLVRRVGLER